MKRKNRDLDIFSLSFLDIISCGFGAVVLLVLISSNSESSIAEEEEKAIAFLQQVLKAEETVKSLQRDLAVESGDLASKELLLGNLQGMSDQTMQQQQSASEKSEKLQKTLSGLELVQTSLTRLKRSSISQGSTLKRDVEVGGIPVDSDYVIFIVDTSGSMKEIWNRVTSELENIIRIHPKIKGFQILNDNGTHILSGYEGRWIPDTPKRRESVISLFKTWNSASNSSPVEGLEVALRRYANPNTKLSIISLEMSIVELLTIPSSMH